MSDSITIEDTFDDCVESACEEVRQAVIEYLDDNKDEDCAPDLHGHLNYSGRFDEIIDGAVPIYTSEIDAIWYCHKYELIESYNSQGFGDNPMDNDGMAAIYCLISDQVIAWYESEKEDIFDTWKEENPDEEEEDESE